MAAHKAGEKICRRIPTSGRLQRLRAKTPRSAPPKPESIAHVTAAVASFRKAHGQEADYSQKTREAWYNAMGKIHELVGILHKDAELQLYLQVTLNVKKHSKTTDQLYLLKIIHARAEVDIPTQTQNDHSQILIGLEAAKVPYNTQAAEDWLKEEIDLGDGPVSGKEKALYYAKQARLNRPPNRAAEARIANAKRKRNEEFESYISQKLSTPLADLPIQTEGMTLENGDYIVMLRKDSERIRLLDVIANDEKTVQNTVLRKR